ncbi:response regulator transcription factor [Streptomyces sp. NPDC051776]|uniref:response regulator transcription factor n=1 Tax=Streptomyces sp. NPDC051776 TaxID=3155414 RepID=UPI00344A93D9
MTAGPDGPVTIVVVDDHPVVRLGLTGLLATEPDFQVVGEASSGTQAVDRVRVLRPDVVLMDLRMPGGDGVTATERITAEFPGVRVLVLTTYDTDGDIVRAVAAGATGYLLKDAAHHVLLAAVRAAAAGETVLAPPVAARLVTRMRNPPAPALTPREHQVLTLVARGMSNPQIGRELLIGEATVKTHLLHAFEKLHVNDRTAAVTAAIARGILPPPQEPTIQDE